MRFCTNALAIAEPRGKVNTAQSRKVDTTYQQQRPKLCLTWLKLVFAHSMGESRIDTAVARIEAALARMDSARETVVASTPEGGVSNSEKETGGSARVMELVNAHEKLREEVAETLTDLDALIGELEG